jgi:hypothetical protein
MVLKFGSQLHLLIQISVGVARRFSLRYTSRKTSLFKVGFKPTSKVFTITSFLLLLFVTH